MYILRDYGLSLLTFTPMMSPTTPATYSTTLSLNLVNFAATASNSGAFFTPTTTISLNDNTTVPTSTHPASSEKTHQHRDPLLIIPKDIPTIYGCHHAPEPHLIHEAFCVNAYKDIKSQILDDTSQLEPYRDTKSQEGAKFYDDILPHGEYECPDEFPDEPEMESQPLSETTLSLSPHSTKAGLVPTLEPSLHPLPGNLTSCPPIEFIFARGTNETPGLGRIGTTLYFELMKEYPNMTAYGVFYDASAYKGKLMSDARLEKGAKDVEGRVGMWVELERERGQCKETKIVLGGFSLGAAVLQKTKLSPEEQERVDAIVIFGYPWKLRPKKQAQYPITAEKVWTKCIPQDPVCNVESIFSDGTLVAHKGYAEYVQEAVEFIRRMVRTGFD